MTKKALEAKTTSKAFNLPQKDQRFNLPFGLYLHLLL